MNKCCQTYRGFHSAMCKRRVCHVWKVKQQITSTSAPKGIWIGWCDQCNTRTAQYWDFGAALGATLYHITLNHRKI